jgi:predicted amidohydrolase YtcJ
MVWKKIVTAATAVFALALLVASCGGSNERPADTVLRNGQVMTIDASNSVQQAVAVRDGKIVYVGSNAGVVDWIGANTKVIELGGRMLMPGFVDAHLHSLSGGRALLMCDLAYAPLSHTQLAAQIQTCLDSTAAKEPDAWLEVVNWDRQATSSIDGDPTKALLDGLTTQRPIAVTSTDFHGVLANSRALSLAKITASTPDPSGGKFLRDANGAPTGICEDAAGWQLKAAIPADTDADLLKQGRAALSAFREQGITTFMDAAASDIHGKTFKALQQSGELTARANFAIALVPEMAAVSPADTIAAAKATSTAIDQGTPVAAPGLRARIVKVFMDGVVNAPADTGALLSPYFTNTGTDAAPNWQPGSNIGSVYYPPEVLKPLMLAAADAGLDFHSHATGERAVRQALDAYENLRRQRPNADFRPAIAHDETVAVADYPRFAALNVSATMSYQWAQRASYSIGETENHLGPDRFARMEPFGSLRNAGARVISGSDWPIDPFDTFLALKVGVTRSGDPTNPNSPASYDPIFEGKINADPALSRADVLRSITMNAAYQLRMETYIGSIEVGKFADMIVLDKNFMTVPEEELARNKVLLTMVGGKTVMAIDAFSSSLGVSQRTLNARVVKLSPMGSAGHAALVGGRFGGDGHRSCSAFVPTLDSLRTQWAARQAASPTSN